MTTKVSFDELDRELCRNCQYMSACQAEIGTTAGLRIHVRCRHFEMCRRIQEYYQKFLNSDPIIPDWNEFRKEDNL